MAKAKTNLSKRLIAALLSVLMLLSIVPFSATTALAATNEHPDAVTLTVKDENGSSIEGADVTFTIDSQTNGDSWKSGTNLTTDEYGCVEILSKAEFIADDLTFTATVSKEGFETNETIADAAITSDDQNFEVVLISTTIDDVNIEGKTLTYNGAPQELVSITGLQDTDTVGYGTLPAGVTLNEDGEPVATDADTYELTVTVSRDGKDDLITKVTTVINPANIEGIDITPVTGLKYNATNQALVTLTGSFAEDDAVTWTVNGTDEDSDAIPERMAVGSYTVKLTIDRGLNYNRFEKTVDVDIALGEIDLGDLKIEANDRTYDTTEQDLLIVTKDGDYTLEYSTDEQTSWVKDTIPVATNAGEYVIYVKATKDNYSDKETPAFPITVTISKADQSFDFDEYDAMENDANPETIELKGAVPYGQTYDFSATDVEALANGTITYEIVADEYAAEIATDGILTVNHPGAITVIAKLSGNDNYNECVIKYYLDVTGAVSSNGQYIEFAETERNFVIGTSSTISEQKATKKSIWIIGDITYSINNVEGVTINRSNGKLTVTDINKLVEEVRNGNNEIVVTAEKEATRLYGADKVSYKIALSFEATPAEPYTLSATDGTNDWYKTKATITPAAGYTIAQNASGTFSATTEFNNQGTDVRYVYLKNTETGAITDRIAVNIKIDSVNPADLKIEFSELNLVQKLGQSLGFYNPTVTITFTAKDVTSGIDHFDWTYTPESGTPVTEEIAVTVTGDTATATLTLPATQAEQMHGKISFTATDKASNEIGKTDDYVFIVDTIAPELSVKYQGEEPYTAQEDTYNGAHFFNSDVVVELTITETNFYAEDVIVKVSKDSAAPTVVTPSWYNKVGTFTLAGDGDYVVYVTYTDKANNKMADYASETITVDKTPPVVKIDYVHNGDIQKTIFTVTEHNFRASDVVITGTMQDIKGDNVAFTAAQLTTILNNATWTKAGDVHTYEYDQYVNGIYNLKMDYKDISGWDAVQEVEDEFIIDHGAPTEPTIEYITTPWDTFLSVVTFGYYNPSVTVRFTSYDTSAGVKTFTWGYTKQDGASSIAHPDTLADATVDAVQDQTDKTKFTAEITLTAEEAAQYRGYLSVLATDKFQNNSVKKVDNGNIIVVDTIAPEITVEYTEADRVIDKDYYYNNAVDVKFTVTEANFYAEDVVVTVTKNGAAFDYGTITWGSRNAEDKTIGTFTLPAPADHSGDGHYVITVEYTDRSNNEMVKYVSDTHTIDTTLPVINVEYQNKTVANKLTDRDGNEREYFADTQTAVVTITEHNFIAEEVKFSIVAKDVTGADLDADALNSKTAWSVDSTGDVHTITITYPGDANYTFDVEYTDNATNAAEDYATDYFTVDKTDPTNLKVDYSTSVLDTVLESVTFGFYNAKMTVTLTAEDPTSEVHSFLYSYLNAAGVSNVNAELINEAIQAADIEYSADRKTAAVTFEIPKMVLGNDNQFNGTVEFTATDRAGNETDAHKETKRIVVDNIAPTATVQYNTPVNEVNGISYYDGDINATVTITEANFYANDVQVMVAKDGGAPYAVTPSWTDNSVDTHTGTFTLTEDGDYIITINYRDKSSNQMQTYTSNQLTVDTDIQAPTYSINGVAKTEEGGAYKNDVTVAFSFEDQNFDTKTIRLERTRFNSVEDVTDDFIRSSDTDQGGSGSFEIPSEVENDGIYVLTIGITDKANHTTESSLKFTINRYGSVYEYSDYLTSLLEKQYIKIDGNNSEAITQDLVITEYNANQILTDSLNILITRDGEAIDTQYTSTPTVDGNAGIGESGWYQYAYTIAKENFAEDGVYKITLTSAYAADDSDRNESTSVPENSIDAAGNQILHTMDFTVDTTKPEIRNIVNLDKPIVNAQTLDVDYTVVDVGGLQSIEVIVNGSTIDTITEFGDSAFNYSGSFTLNESSDAQTVQLKVTDIAGNVTDTASDDFSTNELYVFNDTITVSTNFFVRWYANQPLFWGSIGGVVVLAGLIWFLVAFKRRKKDDKEAK